MTVRPHERLRALGWSELFERHFEELGRPDVVPARVAGVQRSTFRVLTEDGPRTAVPSGLLLHEDLPRSEYPAVGDFVAVRLAEDDTAVVTDVLPRRTRFSRAVGGADGRRPAAVTEQVIATNIDYVFVVTALDQDFSVPRMERYVAAVLASGAEPVLILNKTDLAENLARAEREVRAALPDLPLHTLSARADEGVEVLRPYFREGTTVALIGSSGVGKSTLTNRLLGADVAVTGDVRTEDGKGRHTTTTRELYVLPGGGVLIDNPGLREIAVWSDQVEDTFEDVQELASHCRYRGCTHTNEPGCAVLAAVASGGLDAGRLQTYRQLEREAEAFTRREGRPPRRPSTGPGGPGRARRKG
ncbi:ribosome small subunit-dependent GTPase A [Deinococcus pimensis]|uniref:ribosome small subunit-dependent GTPase A n=1 Tax=Deinococcus pimensis TaxID=309888 RepID=UPI0004B0B98C|nr:ribosome small subunit-dependent GTPase A [Deinococcus pimensis]